MTTASPTSPQVLEVYALLQIAAEAFLNESDRLDPAKPPTGSDPFSLTVGMLTEGNLHSSVMTSAQAEKFKDEWTVISHQANTATGFSATLFEYIGDPSKRLTSSKHVISIRSTEFIEDSARDSKAGNELEIRETGWAFGQIADMEAWWYSLPAEVRAGKVDVTGYSLGGHLATAFNLLHPEVEHTYTFNGAGVGKVNTGSLGDAIAEFSSRSEPPRLSRRPVALSQTLIAA